MVGLLLLFFFKISVQFIIASVPIIHASYWLCHGSDMQLSLLLGAFSLFSSLPGWTEADFRKFIDCFNKATLENDLAFTN